MSHADLRVRIVNALNEVISKVEHEEPEEAAQRLDKATDLVAQWLIAVERPCPFCDRPVRRWRPRDE